MRSGSGWPKSQPRNALVSTRKADIQERFRQHLEAQQKMTECANEAKRLHDDGDLKGARRALAKAEQWRTKLDLLTPPAADSSRPTGSKTRLRSGK